VAQAAARYDEFAEWYEEWIGDATPLIAAQPGLLPAVTGERVLDMPSASPSHRLPSRRSCSGGAAALESAEAGSRPVSSCGVRVIRAS
jgi:hypothetical protein